MFEALADLFSRLGGRAPRADTDANGERLAVAALLTYVATIDGKLLDSETQALERMLADRFSLGAAAARRLIDAGLKADREATDFTDFTAKLRRRLDARERARLIAMMWSVARADGEVHEFEETLIGRVAKLLDVDEALSSGSGAGV